VLHERAGATTDGRYPSQAVHCVDQQHHHAILRLRLEASYPQHFLSRVDGPVASGDRTATRRSDTHYPDRAIQGSQATSGSEARHSTVDTWPRRASGDADGAPNAELYRRLTAALQSGDIDAVKGALAPGQRWQRPGNPQDHGAPTLFTNKLAGHQADRWQHRHP
jgi:hypothetical protein